MQQKAENVAILLEIIPNLWLYIAKNNIYSKKYGDV